MKTAKNIKLSIIIVTYNSKYFPCMAFEALQKSKVNFNFEVIFVDNNSTDESVSYLEKMHKNGSLHLIRSKTNIGFGSANNLGMKKARGEYLMIHNPDITVNENSLQQIIDYLEKHNEIGLLGTKLIYHNGDIQESCRRFMTFTDLIIKRTFLRYIPKFKRRLDSYLMEDFDHNKVQNVDLVTGAIMVGRKDFLYNQLKGFDERYFLFMEDFDLCQMVWKAGKSVVYYPKVEILHYHKRLSGGSFFSQFFQKTFWLHLVSAFKYFWKWRGGKSHN